MTKELFHGRHHPKYQVIKMYDKPSTDRCKKTQQLLNAHYSIIVNDNLSSREGYDYKVAATNRSVKSHLPRASVPKKGWLTACRNDRSVRAIGEKLESITGLTSGMVKPQEQIVNVSAAIHPLCVVLREKEYFNGKHQEFMSTSRKDI